MRIVHVIAEFSRREAMGRTVVETAARVAGEHHLVTATAHDSHELFASVCELSGKVGTFPLGRVDELTAALDRIRPDVVHLHAGALGPFQALACLRGRRVVTTMYAWPTLPGPRALRRASLAQLWTSNVLRPRVALTTLVTPGLAAMTLRKAGVRALLSPDPRVLSRLEGRTSYPVHRLPSGGAPDPRRASFTPADGRPTVVFAGRAETVRGLDTLLAAFPEVLTKVPSARLRLLLLPRPELADILARAGAAGLGDALEVLTDPMPDLAGALADAQVGTWPFLYDYTTSPPAMAVAEALSVGLPVVSTEVACVRAAVRHEIDGVLVPPSDPRALAAALSRLLVDEVSWRRFAQAGPEAVAGRLSWDRAAEVTASAYRHAVA